MEIPDGLFYAGELIDIEDGMLLTLPGCLKVIADSFCGWYDVSRVQRFCATRRVKDEGVVIDITGYLL
jgi:hypothetical protein